MKVWPFLDGTIYGLTYGLQENIMILFMALKKGQSSKKSSFTMPPSFLVIIKGSYF